MTPTTLKKGETWVDLSLLTATTARVADSNIFRTGDEVAAPPGYSWEDLSERGADGETLGHPGDLELLFDAMTGHQAPSWSVRELSAAIDLADPAAIVAIEKVDERLDLEALLERFPDLAPGAKARPARAAKPPRRRKLDVA